jgi:type IV secretion system protein TrbC
MLGKVNRIILMSMLALPGRVWAASSGPTLPFEGPLRMLANALGGPVALSIAIIALMATGAVLVFGGELNEFARRACLLVLAISFLVSGSAFMTTLFGVTGALV